MRARAVGVGVLLAASVVAATSAGTAHSAPSAPAARGGWTVERVRVESLTPGGHLSATGIGDYRGALEVVRAGSGVGVINDVGFEDYVRGIAEVPNSWPVEALKAQAIAARTYALHEMKNRQSSAATALGADICPTQTCQVYVGLEKERSEGGQRWVSAVNATRGQVLLRRGQPIRAMYSAGPYKPPPPAPGQRPPPPGPVRGHGAGMDQHGALTKALRGAKASSILASYYGGAKPTRLTPPRIPEAIRVSLEPVRSNATITGPGRFRVLDGAGNLLAVVATGSWRVLPGPQGRVRVVPPAGQEAPPAVEALGHEPLSAPPDGQRLLRFRLSAPALVHLAVTGPGGTPAAATPPQLMEAGESALPVPPLALPGPHVVAVVADAGGNRVTKAPVEIAPPGAALPGPPEPVAASLDAVAVDARPLSRQTPPALLAGVAFVLLLTAAVGLVFNWLRPSTT